MPEEVTSLEPPAKPFNEEMLIQRIRNGEHDLFYELIRPYERRVYSAAFAILRNEADAEDVAQEAMLKAFKHIRQFHAEARFSTRLTQITINEALVRFTHMVHRRVFDPLRANGCVLAAWPEPHATTGLQGEPRPTRPTKGIPDIARNPRSRVGILRRCEGA